MLFAIYGKSSGDVEMSSNRPAVERGKLYKLSEVAAILGVHVKTCERWARFGELPARKIGRRRWYVLGDDLLSVDFDKIAVPGKT